MFLRCPGIFLTSPLDLGFWLLQLSPIVTTNQIVTQFSQNLIDQHDFIYKTEHISTVLLNMWVEDELIRVILLPQTGFLGFLSFSQVQFPLQMEMTCYWRNMARKLLVYT